jgi:hypothetical protein
MIVDVTTKRVEQDERDRPLAIENSRRGENEALWSTIVTQKKRTVQ